MGDTAYWEAHGAKLLDASYIKDIAAHLLSLNGQVHTLRETRPVLRRPLPPELAFLCDALVFGTFRPEFAAQFRSAPGRFVIPSSMLCAEYNRWRGMADHVSSKSFTKTMARGITRDTSGNRYNAFRIDASLLRAPLMP